MVLSLTFFFITALIIALSTIGYGFFTIRLLKLDNIISNHGLSGILGLLFLSVAGSYTHLFFAHNYTHNIIIILIGLMFLSKFRSKNFEQLKILLTFFVLLFISLVISKTNEDFGYYHLPNSIQFAEQKLQFGLGNINHGFKHISSIFQLMSLNYLPFFKYNLFNLTNFLFLLFFSMFAFTSVHNNFTTKLNFSKIFLSFFFILFISKFSRIAEYGSDIAGQIIIAIYFFYIIEIFFNKKLSNKDLINYSNLSLILIIFAITLKFILVIYSILFFFVLFIIFKKKIFFDTLKPFLLFFSVATLMIFVLYNFSSTGCLIYPIEKLCFHSTFDWALDSKTVSYLNFHYELWAKSGKGPNFSVENPYNYIDSFNWISNWISNYFIGKFTDFILVSLVIIIIFSLFFLKNFALSNYKYKEFDFKHVYFYISLLIIFIIWFINFPTLRYAGFIIVFIIITYPYVIFADKFINFSKQYNIKKILVIFIISYSIFLIKNIQRINNEYNISINSNHNFKNFPFFWIDNKVAKEIVINGHKVYKVEGMCWATKSTCVRKIDNLKIKKKNHYIFYSIKK
jgi:hypothetical protein